MNLHSTWRLAGGKHYAITSGIIAALLVGGSVTSHAQGRAAAAKRYKNCKALNSVYPHGVGRPGANDETSGDPVINFTVNRAVYNKNRSKDRDKDGIACEKH